jgi:dihydrofolate reductase
MRKIIVSNLVTLDGYFAGPNGEIGWFITGEDFFEGTEAQFDAVDALLFGRVTYEGMLSYWTSQQAIEFDPVIAGRMNNQNKIVFSRTLDRVECGEWDNARLIKGDLGEEVRRLKAQPGKNMLIFGSGQIVAQLTQLGLIDLYTLFVNPVVLGSGKSMFAGVDHTVRLKLTESKVFKSGMVRVIYEPEVTA